MIYFIWIIIFLSIYSAIVRYKNHKFEEWLHHEKRPKKIKISNIIIFYLSVIIIILVMFYDNSLSPDEIGLKHEINPIICFIIGFIVNCLWQLLYSKKLHKFSIFKSTINNYRTYRSILPRKTKDKKLLIISLILLNPIYEEFLFRGILVYKLGLLIENFYITIIIGYLVFITLHLYQGISVIFQHTLHYIFFIAILFSPLGLMGVIGFHFGSDLFPFIMIKHTINDYAIKYRNYRKNIRAKL